MQHVFETDESDSATHFESPSLSVSGEGEGLKSLWLANVLDFFRIDIDCCKNYDAHGFYKYMECTGV